VAGYNKDSLRETVRRREDMLLPDISSIKGIPLPAPHADISMRLFRWLITTGDFNPNKMSRPFGRPSLCSFQVRGFYFVKSIPFLVFVRFDKVYNPAFHEEPFNHSPSAFPRLFTLTSW